MITLVLGGVLFICCAYVGTGIKLYYGKRSELYGQCIAYIDYMKENIGFLKTPLVSATRSFCEGKKGEFIKILQQYCNLLERGQLNKVNCAKLVNTPYIDRERQILLSEFIFGLGKVDCETQIDNLSKARAALAVPKDYYDKKYKTSGTLAYKLGIVAGIAAMIIAA